MGWNWKYEDGEKKYYKPKFDFPTQPTTTTVPSTIQEASTNDTIDDIITSVKEIVTEFAAGQSADTTAPQTIQDITNSGVVETITTSIIEETANSTIIITTTESVILTNSMVGVQEAGTTMLNDAVDNATSIPDVDWIDSGTENMFFNHNLTMTHEEFEESSQKLYIMLGLILAVLIIILIFVFAVYNRYRKTTLYDMDGFAVRKNKVISKTSEACYGNESVLIESNEIENYKF